jgi:selenide, water dikinase
MTTPLTQMAHGAGCGCKLSKAQLTEVLASMPGLPIDPAILVSGATSDDAAVFNVRDDLAIVATVDFFTPIVDDPATFGAIAATNALSDLYAMGAKPILTLAVAGFPKDGDMAVLAEIMRGGAEVALAAGAPVLGGHTIDDPEPKYGLVAIGTVDPSKMLTNANGKAGDRLVLTKGIGTGAISAGIRAERAGPAAIEGAIASMLTSNAAASEAAVAAGATCATDVTGFGLAGHLLELVQASGVAAVLRVDRIPLLPGAIDMIATGNNPGGTERNREAFGDLVDFSHQITDVAKTSMFDPQTSGGLIISIAAERFPTLMGELAARGVSSSPIGQLVDGPVGRVGVFSPVNQVGASGGGSRTAAKEAVEGEEPPPPPPGAPGVPGIPPGMPDLPPGMFPPGMGGGSPPS